jgi:glycosyltransferase involved in cell wall biosynthesis
VTSNLRAASMAEVRLLDERSGRVAERLRVALVSPRFWPYVGGLETHVGRLADELARRGHAVEVFTQRSEQQSPRHEWIGGVQVQRCTGLFGQFTYSVPVGLRRALGAGERAFDVVHVHGYHSLAALAAVGVRGIDSPLIFTPHYHGTGHTALARAAHVIYRPFGRRLFGRASRVVCVSADEEDLVRRDFGSDVASRTVIIPNGVDVAALRKAAPFELRHQVVLSVGRLVEYKNIELLLAAARTLPASARIVIVGTGPDRRRLEKLVDGYGIAARVSFLGRVSDSDLRRWYRSATVTVEMSRHEAFGIALLEALVAGSRVIASAIPAHRRVSVLVGGSPVKFVPPEADATELSLSLAEALREGRPPTPALSRVPTWPSVAAQTERVYADALDRPGGSRGPRWSTARAPWRSRSQSVRPPCDSVRAPRTENP